MFTQSASVRVKDPKQLKELIEWLCSIGRITIKAVPLDVFDYLIVYDRWYTNISEESLALYRKELPELIDCGMNTEMFKALVALRDIGDYMQWFITTKGKWVFSKYSYKKCHSQYAGVWQQTCRKATPAEIVEHFKDNIAMHVVKKTCTAGVCPDLDDTASCDACSFATSLSQPKAVECSKQLPLVTFDQAKKLNLLGFDWLDSGICNSYTLECGKALGFAEDIPIGSLIGFPVGKSTVLAPTVALALKWMRDVKEMVFEVSYCRGRNCTIYTGRTSEPNKMTRHKHTYEEAEFDLLDELLKLLDENN